MKCETLDMKENSKNYLFFFNFAHAHFSHAHSPKRAAALKQSLLQADGLSYLY